MPAGVGGAVHPGTGYPTAGKNDSGTPGNLFQLIGDQVARNLIKTDYFFDQITASPNTAQIMEGDYGEWLPTPSPLGYRREDGPGSGFQPRPTGGAQNGFPDEEYVRLHDLRTVAMEVDPGRGEIPTAADDWTDYIPFVHTFIAAYQWRSIKSTEAERGAELEKQFAAAREARSKPGHPQATHPQEMHLGGDGTRFAGPPSGPAPIVEGPMKGGDFIRQGGRRTSDAVAEYNATLQERAPTHMAGTGIEIGLLFLPGPEDTVMFAIIEARGLKVAIQGGKRVLLREGKEIAEAEARALLQEYKARKANQTPDPQTTRLYPDGSVRTPDGKFAGTTGTIPGTPGVLQAEKIRPELRRVPGGLFVKDQFLDGGQQQLHFAEFLLRSGALRDAREELVTRHRGDSAIRWSKSAHVRQHMRIPAHCSDARIGVEQGAHHRASIETRPGRHVSLGGPHERGIVDLDLLEEPGRPGGCLDRFQNEGFALASYGGGAPLELKAIRQLHELGPVRPDDFRFGHLHGTPRHKTSHSAIGIILRRQG
jgi:hypothetical protein